MEKRGIDSLDGPGKNHEWCLLERRLPMARKKRRMARRFELAFIQCRIAKSCFSKRQPGQFSSPVRHSKEWLDTGELTFLASSPSSPEGGRELASCLESMV